MNRRFLGVLSVGVVIVSLAFLAIGGIHAASTPTIMVDPKVSGGAPTESFSVNILIANVTDLYAWQFNLTFTPSVLEAVSVAEGPFLEQFGTTLMATPNINNTGGWVFAGAAFLSWDEGGANGNGVLATVNFRVLADGMSDLHLSLADTGLRTYDGSVPVPMAYEAVDGVFAYPRDLAVTGLVASVSSVPAGELVSLTATILNKGIVDEVVNATLYRNSTLADTKTKIALGSEASTSVVFSWDTTGVPAGSYIMKAEVSVVPGENDTANNVFSDGTITIGLVHDVAVTDLTVAPASVQSGEQVTIGVRAYNKGSATESFSVTVACGATVVGTKEFVALAPGVSETLTLLWETKGMAAGSYLLTATAETLEGETTTEDNVFSNVSFQITSPPFTLPMEWLIAIIAVIIILAVAMFLFLKRRPKKT